MNKIEYKFKSRDYLIFFRYRDFVMMYIKTLKTCKFESGTFTFDFEATATE